MKTKILISAANGIIMNSLIKTLKKNFYVIGIDSEVHGSGAYICDEFYLSPKGTDIRFLNFLKNLGKKVEYIFLFVDEEINLINKNRKKLSSIIKKIIISNNKTLNICLNKSKFHNFCIKNNFNVPGLNYKKKMLAKPIFGRGSKNIFEITNFNDFKFFKSKQNYIVQQFIKGKEYTVDCLFDKNGKIIFALPRIRIVHKGVSIVGQIVKDKNVLLEINKISNKLKFFGPINIQLIKDKRGKIWFLEINPRLSGSVEFSIKAGFNPLNYFIPKRKFVISKIKYNKVFKRSLIINKE